MKKEATNSINIATGNSKSVGIVRNGYGPGGKCVCADCGHKFSHKTGKPCTSSKCPECGSENVSRMMETAESLIDQIVKGDSPAEVIENYLLYHDPRYQDKYPCYYPTGGEPSEDIDAPLSESDEESYRRLCRVAKKEGWSVQKNTFVKGNITVHILKRGGKYFAEVGPTAHPTERPKGEYQGTVAYILRDQQGNRSFASLDQVYRVISLYFLQGKR